jgi:hypothetical protein
MDETAVRRGLVYERQSPEGLVWRRDKSSGKVRMRLFVLFFIAFFLYETIGVIVFGFPSLHDMSGK